MTLSVCVKWESLPFSISRDEEEKEMAFFAWIRNAVKHAVVGGVQDALEQLGEAAAAQPSEPVALQLTLTVTPAEKRLGKGAKP
jgi:hypothetical protein